MSLAWVILAGCANPFSTREPEPPEQNASNFIPPSTPDIVFVNLQIAFQERNVENYIRSFVDSTRSTRKFVFVPDLGVAFNQPGTFEGWDLRDERRYLTQLFQATPGDSLLSLTFIEVSRNEGSTTADFTQNYIIQAHHLRQDKNIPVLYRGQAKFTLEVNTTGDWAIFRWEDISNDQDPSWSDLKAFFQ